MKWGFHDFFFLKEHNWTKWLVITFSMRNIFYVKSGWSCSMKWGFSRNFFLTKTKLNQNDWFIMDLRSNEILMELGWIYTRIFFGKKTKLKQLEILHRARSWDVETLCSSDFTNQPNWIIWILSHIWSAA